MRGIGGVAGGVVGYQLDQQIKELDEATAGSGVDVSETPDGTGGERKRREKARARTEQSH